MMQQYLCTNPDQSQNELLSDHLRPDSMTTDYGARTATCCLQRPGDKLNVDAPFLNA